MLVGEDVALHGDCRVEQLVPGGLDHPVGLAGGQGGRGQVDEPPDPASSSSEYLPGTAWSEARE